MTILTLTPAGLWHSIKVTAAFQGGKDTLRSNPTPTPNNTSQESGTQEVQEIHQGVFFNFITP